MDQIELRGLRVRGRHGVLAFERRDGQDFLVDAVLSVDTRPAAATDDLTLTVDYGTLSERLAQIVAGEPVQLIETLAQRLASACLDEPAVQRVRITVHKPQAPISLPFSDVAVTITRDRPVQAVLALGSNLGDRQDILSGGADAIAGLAEVRVTAVSPVYETVPVGGPSQPDYLNAVMLVAISLPSRELLARLNQIEAEFDRVRVVRWGPRTLDLDIITVSGERSDDPELTLPHPRAHERAFVLAPWLDADPDAVLPGHGLVADLLARVDQSGIRRSGIPLGLPGAGA